MVQDNACRAFNLAHAHLQIIFPRRPALVESFFARLGTRRSEEETAIVETEVVGTEVVESDGDREPE